MDINVECRITSQVLQVILKSNVSNN